MSRWITAQHAAERYALHIKSVYRIGRRLPPSAKRKRDGQRQYLEEAFREHTRKQGKEPLPERYERPKEAPQEGEGAQLGTPPDQDPGGQIAWLRNRVEALERERREQQERFDRELERMDAERMRMHHRFDQLLDAFREISARPQAPAIIERHHIDKTVVVEQEPEAPEIDQDAPKGYADWLRSFR